jgi:hypothetical protein
MKQQRVNTIFAVRAVAVAVFLCLGVGGIFYSRFVSVSSGAESTPTAEATPKPKRSSAKTEAKPTPTPSDAKFSKFTHETHEAMSLTCDACHSVPTSNWNTVRPKDTAFEDVTDYPKHERCIDCHREQFFSGKPPTICSVCHTNPSPNDSTRHPFANPRELFDVSPKGKQAASAFEIYFPHDKHIEIVSSVDNRFDLKRSGLSFVNAGYTRRAGEESCAVCHQTYKPQGKSDDEYFTPAPKDLGDGFWLKKGTFKSGPANHSTCFTCHSTDSGITPAPTDCATCHKPKEKLPAYDFDAALASKMGLNDKEMTLDWSRRDSSGTFRHEFSMHADLSCNTCHNVTTMNTTSGKTKKVPVASCAPCHITGTTDDGGILNFEIDARKKDSKFSCVKCHTSFGAKAVPESHTKAVVAAGGN